MKYSLYEMLHSSTRDHFSAWAMHPQVEPNIVRFRTSPESFVHTEYAALLVYEAALKATGDAPDSMELDERSSWFAAAAECFSSSFWRHMAGRTFSLLGWADNQNDAQELIVNSDLWEDRAISGDYKLQVMHYVGGFVGMFALHDEGFIGGPIFIVEFD